MLAMAQTCAVLDLEGHIVQAEVDISPGLPAFNVVGLADIAVQESRERVRAALRNSGCKFHMRRITVNLAPADLKRRDRPTTSPLPPASCSARDRLGLRRNPRYFWASCPWMGVCATLMASCPWYQWPVTGDLRRCSFQRPTPARRRWLMASRFSR